MARKSRTSRNPVSADLARSRPAKHLQRVVNGKSPPRSGQGDGFFDLQVNGFAGVDFQQPELRFAEIHRAMKALHAHQTRRILFTLITDRIDGLCRKLERVEEFRRHDVMVARTIAGYHLEGPYLRREVGFSGAHDASLMSRPRIAEFERVWSASNGNIRLITLAPELPGAAEFIAHVAAKGVRVAIGHSNADESQIDIAIAAGLRLCTHLGNGVPQQMHRHDNIMQRLLARDELTAAFIPDGIHLPNNVLKNFVRSKPASRVLFTTDCMAAAGAPPGQYSLGRLVTQVGEDGVVRQPDDPLSFAGSSLTMDTACRNVEDALDWSRKNAVAACSSRVAQFFGL